MERKHSPGPDFFSIVLHIQPGAESSLRAMRDNRFLVVLSLGSTVMTYTIQFKGMTTFARTYPYDGQDVGSRTRSARADDPKLQSKFEGKIFEYQFGHSPLSFTCKDHQVGSKNHLGAVLTTNTCPASPKVEVRLRTSFHNIIYLNTTYGQSQLDEFSFEMVVKIAEREASSRLSPSSSAETDRGNHPASYQSRLRLSAVLDSE